MKTNFKRDIQWWDAKAPQEEQDIVDEAINRALRWREIERHLEGVETILDVGAGTGAFSIPLVKKGFSVTHLDFSPSMLEIASQKASGLKTITFVEGNAVDLSLFPDCSFDLVLNMDGAISFCGPEAERAIFECCRVARKTLIITVSHKAWMVPLWVKTSLAVSDRILPAVYTMTNEGKWDQEQFPENVMLSKGCTQGYFSAFRAFLPSELKVLVERAGMQVVRIGGLGSLANLCGAETIEKVLKNDALFQEFVTLCETFDTEILPEGPGTSQRAGLIAVAEREKSV